MQFIVSRNALLRALQHTRCAITKQEIQVFKCFVFSFDGKTMTVHASNGSVWMTENVLLDDEPVEPRPIAIYYCDLMKPIKALDEQPLRFEVQEYQVIVHHQIGSFRMALYQNPTEFFDFKAPTPDAYADDGYQMEYEVPCLQSILSRCNYAMAHDELRPVMNGVYFNLTSEYCDYVSSDGIKLVRVRKNRSPESTFVANDLSFIIPYPVVKALLKVMPSTGDATIQYQKELMKEHTHTNSSGQREKHLSTKRKPQCRIIIDDTLTISFNTVEGRYPMYWTVIPNRHNFSMTIERKALVKSFDRLRLFASTTGLVKMDIAKTALKLSAEDNGYALAADETLPCECEPADGRSPISLRIGVNAQHVSQTLKSLSTEKVTVFFIDSSRAMLVQPQPQPYNEEISILLIPMMCND